MFFGYGNYSLSNQFQHIVLRLKSYYHIEFIEILPFLILLYHPINKLNQAHISKTICVIVRISAHIFLNLSNSVPATSFSINNINLLESRQLSSKLIFLFSQKKAMYFFVTPKRKGFCKQK